MKGRGRWPARDYPPGERVAISWRVTPELKQWIDNQAEASGRSLSQQLEILLQRAADADKEFFGAATLAFGRVNSGIVLLLGLVLSDAERNAQEQGFEHPEAAPVAAAALAEVIAILTGIEISVARPEAIPEATWRMRIELCLRPLHQLRDHLAGDRQEPARLLDQLILDRLTDDQKKRIVAPLP